MEKGNYENCQVKLTDAWGFNFFISLPFFIIGDGLVSFSKDRELKTFRICQTFQTVKGNLVWFR